MDFDSRWWDVYLPKFSFYYGFLLGNAKEAQWEDTPIHLHCSEENGKILYKPA